MDSTKYLEILKENIIPYRDEIRTFQQDNAPPQKTSKILNELNDAGIGVLDWPRYSANINPIKNIWAILKCKVKKSSPTTLEEMGNIALEL